MAPGPESFTLYGWLACVWVLIVSFQYGYHISSLNQIQAVLTCNSKTPESGLISTSSHYLNMPECIPMSDATFSVVTSVYTVGGLLGSLFANVVMDRWGRKGSASASTTLFAVGSTLMGLSPGLTLLIIGRLLVGVGAGFGMCVGPIFISEIAPQKIKGMVGVLTQFAIVIGIMFTQLMGLNLATPTRWRIVLLASAVLSVIQLLLGPLMVESPTWLGRNGMIDAKDLASRRLWGNIPLSIRRESLDETEDPLLEGADFENQRKMLEQENAAISVPHLLATPALRRPLTIVCFSMLCQQLSGVNAVLYYSNDILSKSLPDLGPYVSLGITIVNVLMTFPPIFLIERLGRKTLLSISSGGAIISLLSVGVGLDSGMVTLTSLAIVTFIASFAIGIGPVPFVMIPEVSPVYAVSALSSVGLSLNWIANFSVGLVFLPLRNFLAHGASDKEGRIFYVFSALLALCTVVLFKAYRG